MPDSLPRQIVGLQDLQPLAPIPAILWVPHPLRPTCFVLHTRADWAAKGGFTNFLKRVSYSAINETGLSDIFLGFQVLVQVKSEAAFELHGPLQKDSGERQDQMKMVLHHNKLMQEILLLLSVTEQELR